MDWLPHLSQFSVFLAISSIGFVFLLVALFFGELFERRKANLAEIEQIVADARRDDAQGKLENNRYRKQLAVQGDLLLQRVAQARQLYANLEQVAKAERAQRAVP